MRHHLTCKSSYVIYLITCKAKMQDHDHECGAQYVGRTIDSMNLRHNGHRNEIKLKNTPLGRHFAKCGYENLSLQIIDCVKPGEKEALLIIEGIWQHKLAVFEVHGSINKRNEMKK